MVQQIQKKINTYKLYVLWLLVWSSIPVKTQSRQVQADLFEWIWICPPLSQSGNLDFYPGNSRHIHWYPLIYIRFDSPFFFCKSVKQLFFIHWDPLQSIKCLKIHSHPILYTLQFVPLAPSNIFHISQNCPTSAIALHTLRRHPAFP